MLSIIPRIIATLINESTRLLNAITLAGIVFEHIFVVADSLMKWDFLRLEIANVEYLIAKTHSIVGLLFDNSYDTLDDDVWHYIEFPLGYYKMSFYSYRNEK